MRSSALCFGMCVLLLYVLLQEFLVYIQMYPLTFKPFRACNFLVSEPSFVATTLELEIIKTRGESGYFSKNSRNQYIREKP